MMKSCIHDGLFKPFEAVVDASDLTEKDKSLFKHLLEEEVNKDNSLRKSSSEQLWQFIQAKEKGGLLVVNSIGVPEQILGKGNNFVLRDVKVKCRGPDDKIYARNPDIQRFIPRGLTLLCWPCDKDGSSSSDNIDPVIYANRKFTGGIGDEDEEQPESPDEWRHSFLEDPESAGLVVAIEKINGEAAHFSGRYINDEFYIITGSKNVHMLLRNEEDIKFYEGARYTTARTVAETVCHTLASMQPDKRQLLQHFLHYTRFTFACELLQPQYQHVVLLDHLERSIIKVIAAYKVPESFESPESLTAVPVHLFLSLVTVLGLERPHYEVLQSAQDDVVRDYCKQVRRERDCEGRVLYYLKDNTYSTIGLCKIKSVWYIIIRALREKASYWLFKQEREADPASVEDIIRSTRKRLAEIKDWLQLSQTCYNQWLDLGEKFLRWCSKQQRAKGSGFSASELRPQFPRWWRQFLASEGSPGAGRLLDDIPPFDD